MKARVTKFSMFVSGEFSLAVSKQLLDTISPGMISLTYNIMRFINKTTILFNGINSGA